MAAFRKPERPYYYIWPSLPQPWGRVGPWSTGLRRKDQAADVDRWLRECAHTRPQLVDAIVRGDFSLQDAWIAKLRGTLDALVAGINDPLLKDAIETFRPECTDNNARAGLDQILEYADDGARLSWLEGNNIRRIYRQAQEAGRRPNSVRRSLHRAVSELLRFHVKDDGKEKALKGVPIPGEADDRVVVVTGDEVRKLVDACVPEDFRWLVVAAIATAVDLKPLMRLTPRDVLEADSMAKIPDTKNRDRPRTIRLSETALLALRMASRGKEPNQQLWPWTKGQVRHMWEVARDTAAGRPSRALRVYRGRAGSTTPAPDPAGDAAQLMLADSGIVTLPLLRFKDLRHLLPTMLAELGYDRREIQSYIGHAKGSKQTDRYITPTGDVGMLNEAAQRMGLAGANLRAVGE